MGLLKNIGNAIAGAVNDVAGTNFSVGKSDGGGSASASNQVATVKVIQKRYEELYNEYINSGMDASLAHINASAGAKAFIESAEGKKAIALVQGNLNSGSPANGSVIKNVLDSAVSTAKNALNGKITQIVDKGAGAVLNKPVLANANPFSDTLAKIGEMGLTKTVKEFLKKHWYWLLIPFGFIGALVYVTIKSGRKGGKRGKNRF